MKTMRMTFWSAMILCVGLAVGASAQVPIFYETMGVPDGNTPIATHAGNEDFDNNDLTFGDGGAPDPADIRTSLTSSGYTNAIGQAASGGGVVFFGTAGGHGARGFSIGNIDASAFTNLVLSFGYRKGSASANVDLAVEWSNDDGDNWNPLSVDFPDPSASTGWYLLDDISLPAAAQVDNLSLRWYRAADGGELRMDDVLLMGEGFIVTLDRQDGYKIAEGTTGTITATPEGGVEPVDYVWSSDLDEAHYDADDNVFTILATASAGDYFAKVDATDAGLAESDATVLFTVAPLHTITIAPADNGTVETDPVDEAFEGDTVTITATPDEDYVVDSVSVEGADETPIAVTPGNTFTMPDQDVTVTVVFEELAAGSYIVDFEGEGETKPGYASGTVNLSGLDWNMTETLIGTSDADWKNGLRSARLRGYGDSSMTMLEDLTNGLGTISFQYRRYGTATQVDWMVEYSVNGGATWTQVGDDFTAPASDDVQTFSEDVEVGGNVRVRIKRATETGGVNRQLNVDDIVMTPSDEPPPGDLPPIVTFDPPGAAQEVFEGQPVQFDVIADQVPEDAGQMTELGATLLPAGATFPGATGAAPIQATFDWTPMVAGIYTATFIAVDSDGSTPQDMVITVKETPDSALAYYTFNDETPTPDVTAANVVVSDMAISAGSIDYGFVAGNWDGSGVPYAESGGNWGEEERDDAKYFSLTIEAEEGWMFSITNISLLQRATGAGPSAMGINFNGTDDIYLEELEGNTTVATSVPVAGYDAQTSLEIRIQGWDNGWRVTSGGGDFRIDDVLVQGEVFAAGLMVSVDKEDGFRMEQGTEEVLTATAQGGVEPYDYEWDTDLDEEDYEAVGDTFTILDTAPAGDYWVEVTVTDDEDEEADTTVNFTIATKYDINITPPSNGTVETDPDGSAFKDDTVTITADPDPGYVVDEIEVVGDDTTAITVTDNTFTMPDQAVTVTVTFAEIPPPPGLLVQFLADEEDESAPVQEPVFLAENLSLEDDGIAGTGTADVLVNSPSAAWDNQYHYAHSAGTGAYAGERDDDTGYVLTIDANEGYSFSLDGITFKHRATAAGPGMVGVKVNGVNYSGTGDEVSTTVTDYESEALGLTSLTQAVIYVQGWGSEGTGTGQFQMNDLQILGSVQSDDPDPDPDPVDIIIELPAGVASVKFISQVGVSYTLEYTEDLTSGIWIDVDTQIGDGEELELEDDEDGDMRFYRVVTP